MFAHASGDMSQDLVSVGQGDAEHGSGEYLTDGSDEVNRFFFWHGGLFLTGFFFAVNRDREWGGADGAEACFGVITGGLAGGAGDRG